MSDPEQSSVALAATELAAAFPAASLPCPVCIASVKGANLGAHLAKVHAGAPAAAPGTWAGEDRGLRRPLIALLVLTGCVFAAVVVVFPQGGIAFALAGAAVGVAFLGLVLSVLGVFRARLDFDGDDLVLRSALGLRVRRVRPSTIGVGRSREVRLQQHTADREVDAGFYLSVGDGHSAIIVSSPRGTAFRKHWDPTGWHDAAPRRAWDITVDRVAMVALEYELARRGLLRPR